MTALILGGLGLAGATATFLVGRYTAGSSARYELAAGILAGFAVGILVAKGRS